MNVPKLRFKEFDGEWEERKLGELIGSLKSGLSRKLSYKDIGLPVIRANNIENGVLNYNDLKYWYVEDPQGANTSNYLIHKDDILINFINSEAKMGSAAIVRKEPKRDTIYTTNILKMQVNQLADSYFINQFTNTNKYKYFIKVITKPAVNQASFTTIDFKSLCLFIPSIEEQRRIADFFELLNKKIQIQQQKIYLLQEQKKGYMQKIFNQEIRFKDEKVEYPEWQNKSIDEVAKIIMGQSPDSKAYSEDPANTVLVQGNADLKNGKIVPRIYTSQLTKICEIGDIILTVRAPVGIVAKCNIPACIGRGVCAIKADDFLFYYLDYYNMTSQWAKLSQGSTFESVNSNDIKNIVVPQPCEEEKMKISKFFKRLMERIQLEEAKLLELKLQKQGFMQQLFV